MWEGGEKVVFFLYLFIFYFNYFLVCVPGRERPFPHDHDISNETTKTCPHKAVLLIKALPPVSRGDNFMIQALQQSQTQTVVMTFILYSEETLK